MHPGGLLDLRLALRAVAKATLSSLVLAINSLTLKQQHRCYPGEYGASGRIRTSDRSVRSRVLYPAELRMHREMLLETVMVHPGGLLGCASPCGPLLKQRYPPWCSRLTRKP